MLSAFSDAGTDRATDQAGNGDVGRARSPGVVARDMDVVARDILFHENTGDDAEEDGRTKLAQYSALPNLGAMSVLHISASFSILPTMDSG